MARPNEALVAYASIRDKYFGEIPTQLPMEELTKVLYTELENMPITDLALVMSLVNRDYKALQ